MKVGIAKKDITFYENGKGLLGYGMHFHKVETVVTPLFARAFVFFDENENKKIAYINCEVCFVTIALKARIVEHLQNETIEFTAENIMLTAQHTHCSPAGISHYLFYNIVTPGFQRTIFENMAQSIASAILEANKNLMPCTIKLGNADFDETIPIGFNRSIKAYNANPEITTKVTDTRKAISNTMQLLSIEAEDGKLLGAINWFGIHTTSISNDKNVICSDNKGYAATDHENRHDNFISAFSQEAQGDITPNYIYDKKKGWTRGKFECDFESAKWHGKQQADKAEEIIKQSDKATLKNTLDSVVMNVNMASTILDNEFANNQPNACTSSPVIGFAMLQGTKEGPGMPKLAAEGGKLVATIIKWYELHILKYFIPEKLNNVIRKKYYAQGKKKFVIEAGVGRLMGTSKIKDFIIPSFVDPTIAHMKYIGTTKYSKRTPWVPKIVPLQIFQIGELAIVGLPAEITIVAAYRLRTLVMEILSKRNIKHVIINPFANGYSGYITTFEEYQWQCYEGGHTVYGQFTLGAYLTHFKKLCSEFIKPSTERNIPQLELDIFTEDEIWNGYS